MNQWEKINTSLSNETDQLKYSRLPLGRKADGVDSKALPPRHVWRLEVESGYLYCIDDSQPVFVPFKDSDQSDGTLLG